jgi:hypothetical protein
MAEYITLDQLGAQQQQNGGYLSLDAVKKLTRAEIESQVQNDEISQGARSFAGEGVSGKYLSALGGAVRGAGSIGATLMRPFESGEENSARRQKMDDALSQFGADPNSLFYKGGKLSAEIAGTAGVGGALAKPVQALAATRYASGLEPIINGVARGFQTGGFRVGELAGTGLGTAARIGTGAATGYSAAGLVNPDDALTGAVIGGTLPGATQLAGRAGSAIRNAIAPQTSPEVRQLAQRANELGINIPADRLTNSRPLNAAAASLNYVPLSGRAATEDAMNSQLNQALSKTFGQNSSNVTMALRKAETVLGGQFDDVLRNNAVKFDEQFLGELAESANRASNELGTEGASIIARQVDDIIAKGGSGVIDGQAAYNIKRTLDRIGQRNSPEAFYANDLKKALMGALNRSLGPEQAAAFAQTRKQYGAMLDLQRLAKNGAEGEVSVARLANMRGINNPEMQELADIAAQFVKPREGIHGGAQRVFGAGGLLGTGALIGGVPGAALLAGAGMAGGRATNGLLNSQMARNFVLGGPRLLGEPETLGLLTQGAYRGLPVLSAQ